MAKSNSKTKLIGLIITLAMLFAGIVTTWTLYGKGIKDNAESVIKLELDGCDPAILNKFDIALVQKDIEVIQTSQREMRVEQKAGFKEILKRLPEPK